MTQTQGSAPVSGALKESRVIDVNCVTTASPVLAVDVSVTPGLLVRRKHLLLLQLTM